MKIRHFLAFTALALAGCRQLPQQSPEVPPVNKFDDAVLQRIYTLQDKRQTAELLPYLNNAKPQYRREAAIAFASVQDTLAIPPLLGLLTDSAKVVREAAAYALGQVGDAKAEHGIIQRLQQEQQPAVQAALLEALGKVATQAGVSFLAAYEAPNPVALAGQAWGLYRAGLRQQYNDKAVERVISLLSPENPYEARLAAAHFLTRVAQLDLTPYRQAILSAATTDKAPEVRIAATQALSKVKALDKARFLSGIVQRDPDYRVRLSAIRAMAGLDFKEIRPAILAALQDKNINTAIATAEFLQAHPEGINADTLLQVLPQLQDARVRGNLIWVILHNSQPQNQLYLNKRYKQQYQYARDPYDKAALLKGLAGNYDNYPFIAAEMFSATQPVISTSAMDALLTMRQQPDFPKGLEDEFAEIFRKGIGSGDVALVGMSAAAIRDPKLNLRGHYRNVTFLTQAQQKLQLPRDMETNIELQKAINFLSGKGEGETPENPFTHPIDWAQVQAIPADQQVVIHTEKGDIVLQLFVEDAPGSVANFVALTRQDFFDSLYFHRVVPNFVAQGGDKRGDGWGSSDYSIRSEFAPLKYKEGYVGMASAGKDTESNQWFITHSPTPHLDGRYTIFAKVVEGMDVVHQLEVGDRIIDVVLR
ncbi:peptidylprolyl isomerase [Pontibacter sp. 172403-2]|uniref:peptidylprolyl isomerase n=1 Tax=Pontibacter rufus TaxID=2791028 RepID=UPI0018B016BD|nr:peptidylprolyl isomerase [Pontibacter sp. 172403-2]MBF9252041.1 peptidylprolyl isomerase [Pontibacter sp. 172403-2]